MKLKCLVCDNEYHGSWILAKLKITKCPKCGKKWIVHG